MRLLLLSDTVTSYIAGLFDTIEPATPDEEAPAAAAATDDFPPVYVSGEDFDKAGDCKQQAADFKSSGNWEGALAKYTEAVLSAPPSALLYANRANALIKLGRFDAAERDCDLALAENPDSAKVSLNCRPDCANIHVDDRLTSE